MTPDLAAVIEARVRAALAGTYVMMPARVVEYDHVKQQCRVQPLIMSRTRVDGDVVAAPRAQIGSVPVAFQGGGDNSITWKVKPGDIVTLLFASTSLSNWLIHGGVVDPADPRRGNLNDAIAIPALRCFSPQAPAGAAPIGPDGVTADDAMVLAAPELRLGSSAADQDVIRGNAYRAAEDNLLTALGTFATAIGALNPVTAAGAASALNAAITSFKAASSSYLAPGVKVE